MFRRRVENVAKNRLSGLISMLEKPPERLDLAQKQLQDSGSKRIQKQVDREIEDLRIEESMCNSKLWSEI